MLKKLKIVLLVMLFLCIPMMQAIVHANSVEYRGEAEGLIATPDDFFLNISDLLPGDTKEDVAYIKNTTDDNIEIFFKTEPLDRSEYYDDIDYSLLEKINLKITLKKSGASEEETLYDGNLGAESMSEYVSLGTYQKGYDGEFKFKLEVPTSLRNAYTLSNTKVKWIFMVVKDGENPPPDEPDNPDENKESEEQKENQEDNNEVIPSSGSRIKTGDYIIYAVLALVIVTIIAIITMILKKKSSKDEDNKN